MALDFDQTSAKFVGGIGVRVVRRCCHLNCCKMITQPNILKSCRCIADTCWRIPAAALYKWWRMWQTCLAAASLSLTHASNEPPCAPWIWCKRRHPLVAPPFTSSPHGPTSGPRIQTSDFKNNASKLSGNRKDPSHSHQVVQTGHSRKQLLHDGAPTKAKLPRGLSTFTFCFFLGSALAIGRLSQWAGNYKPGPSAINCGWRSRVWRFSWTSETREGAFVSLATFVFVIMEIYTTKVITLGPHLTSKPRHHHHHSTATTKNGHESESGHLALDHDDDVAGCFGRLKSFQSSVQSV